MSKEGSNMKLIYTTPSGGMSVEVEGNHKEIFEQLNEFHEVFEADDCCPLCSSASPKFRVRTVEDNQFYELVCRNPQCRAKLSFGCHKKGDTVFPKRKNEDGTYMENRGWSRWEGKTEKEKPVTKANSKHK